MRILLTHHLPLAGSATGRCTRTLANALALAGHEVLCLIVEGRRGQATQSDTFAIERVRCHPGDPRADLAMDLPSLGLHAATRLTFAELRDDQVVEYRNALRRKLDRCIEKFDPHLVHCQHAWLFSHLALESGAPYVISVQGPELRVLREGERYRRLVEQAVENASRVLVTCRSIAAQVGELFPECAGRIQQVLPPIEAPGAVSHPRGQVLARWGLSSEAPLLVAGEMSSQVSVLLNAKAALDGAGRRVALAICGDGPPRVDLEAQAQHQQLQDVCFTGDLSSPERSELFAAAELALAPSCGSAELLTALEAIFCGTPVLAASGGPLPEVVDDSTGAIVAPDDHELWAASIDRALGENWKASKGRTLQQFAATHYAPAQWLPQYLAVYEEALVQRYGSVDGL